MDSVSPSPLSLVAADLLAMCRDRKPSVHCVTSPVAQNLTANLLLACGAEPSLSVAPGEIEAFASKADGFLVNLGMVDEERERGIESALPILADRAVPWVLDPVKVERSAARDRFAQTLLRWHPRVIRANRSEMAHLRSWAELARMDAVIAETGAVDQVRHGGESWQIDRGHPLMTRVTALGCAGGALSAAFVALDADAGRATAAALLVLAVAGEIAAEHSAGPGSFQAAYLDALYGLEAEALLAGEDRP
ncbi:MAG: hydroxyethylthiazole kinase [Geminicoccaceae bacterium]